MALVGSYTLFGSAFPNSYAKVTSVTGGKLGWSGTMLIWPTKPDPIDPTMPDVLPQSAQSVSVVAPYVEGQDPLQSVYDAAVLLPAFSAMTSDVPKTQISRLAFRLRFTAVERQDILTLAKTSVQIEDWLEQVKDAEYIDLSRADTQGNVNALSNVPSSRADGTMVLAAGRATTILTP